MAKIIGTPRIYYPDRAYNCEIPEYLSGKRVRATWITFKERSIWCCDFAGFETNSQGLLTELEVSDSVIKQQPENSLLAAVALHKTKMTPKIVEFFRINATHKSNPIRKMAVLFFLILVGNGTNWYNMVSGQNIRVFLTIMKKLRIG